MKNIAFPLLLLALAVALSSCRKVNDQVNTEKAFRFFVAKKSGELKNYCFDRVYGLGAPANLEACSNEDKGILLPLNIKTDSSVFVFVKGKRSDTLVIHYNNFEQIGSTEYELNFKITKTFKSSFDSISTSCVPQITNYCNAYPGFFAIAYL